MPFEEDGLKTKYIIRKRIPCSCGGDRWCKLCKGFGYTEKDVDPKAIYFVLRLDEEDWHGEASRAAVCAYAALAEEHNKSLALDLYQLATDLVPGDTDPIGPRAAGAGALKAYREHQRRWDDVKEDLGS